MDGLQHSHQKGELGQDPEGDNEPQKPSIDASSLTNESNDFEAMYKNALAELQRKDMDLKQYGERYRKLALELNKVKVQSNVGHQITDRELEQMVNSLRFNIRNLTFQYFENKTQPGAGKLVRAIQYKSRHQDSVFSYLDMNYESFSNLMQSSSSQRPLIARAFIWATLCHTLFGKFPWTNENVSRSIRDVLQFLYSHSLTEESVYHEEMIRQCHLWRANTSRVILEAVSVTSDGGQGDTARFRDRTAQDIYDILGPFSGPENTGLLEQLQDIVSEALKLDQIISKQVAWLSWVHKPEHLPGTCFDTELMEWNEVESITIDGPNNWLVVSPGLNKWGKSSGQCYDQVNTLFKVIVLRRTNGTVEAPSESERPFWRRKLFGGERT